VKKAAKTTRAAKRAKLPPRAEWDFSKVTRKDSAVVCMREYADECLLWIADGRAADVAHDFYTKMEPSFSQNFGPTDRAALEAAVLAGICQRAQIPRHKVAAPVKPLRVVDPSNFRMSPGGQFVSFVVDWRATNSDIVRDFRKWIHEQSRGKKTEAPWPGSFEGAVSSILSYEEGGIPHDYLDSVAAFGTWHAGATPGGGTFAMQIKALRKMRGEAKGRGDSKRALLTDLAIYRLHRAGLSPEKIGTMLGTGRLKFYDAPLIQRAVRSAEERTRRTLFAAFTVELLTVHFRQFVVGWKSQFLHPAFRQT
jgi:hypothetical protein